MSLTFINSYPDTTDTNQYTYSVGFGTASSDRYIIVTASARKAGASTTISSVTIGGVSATEVHQNTHTGTNTDVSGIFIASVPTGTTGDVVVTYGATMVRSIIGVYAATSLASATATNTYGYISTADPTTSINVPAGGFALGIALTNSSGTTSWTGLTEDFDGTLETFVTYSGASATFETQQTGLTVTADFSGATSEAVASWAVWEISTSTSVTVNSEVVTSTTSLPSPTITAVKNISLSPSALTITSSLPSPSVSAIKNASLSQSALTVTGSLPIPTISAVKNISIDADVVVSQTSLPNPAITTEKNISIPADLVSITSSTQNPSIVAIKNVSLSVGVLTATNSLLTPSISLSGNVSVSADVVTAATSTQTPTITTTKSITVNPNAIVSTFSLPTPSVLTGTVTTNIKHYDSTWIPDTLEYYDGASFVNANLKYYDGTWQTA